MKHISYWKERLKTPVLKIFWFPLNTRCCFWVLCFMERLSLFTILDLKWLHAHNKNHFWGALEEVHTWWCSGISSGFSIRNHHRKFHRDIWDAWDWTLDSSMQSKHHCTISPASQIRSLSIGNLSYLKRILNF